MHFSLESNLSIASRFYLDTAHFPKRRGMFSTATSGSGMLVAAPGSGLSCARKFDAYFDSIIKQFAFVVYCWQEDTSNKKSQKGKSANFDKKFADCPLCRDYTRHIFLSMQHKKERQPFDCRSFLVLFTLLFSLNKIVVPSEE